MKKPIVLIVDDNLLSVRLTSEILHSDYDVKVCTAASCVLDFCKTDTPDLILMDFLMPGLNGLSVCKLLKQDRLSAHIPIIFLAAESALTVETECWEAGCVDFIVKPFVLATLKNRVKFHVKAKLMTDKLKMLASIDGLTGVYNRHFLDHFLAEQTKLSKRNQSPLGMLMIDIDYFKQYNDSYGHIEGDTCLKHVAKCIENCLGRPTDHATRFGGEEFVIVLPNTCNEGVQKVAHKIMNALAALNIRHKSSPLATVTVSIGGISALCNLLDADSLLALSDQQLYLAKNSGRNCTKVSTLNDYSFPGTKSSHLVS